MNDRFDKWMPLLILAWGICGAVPLFIADLPEDGWQYQIWAGIFATTAMFTYVAFKRVGKKIPALSAWAESNVGGMCILFGGTFIASGAGVLFALIPLPHWLHAALAVCLALCALFLLVTERERE